MRPLRLPADRANPAGPCALLSERRLLLVQGAAAEALSGVAAATSIPAHAPPPGRKVAARPSVEPPYGQAGALRVVPRPRRLPRFPYSRCRLRCWRPAAQATARR